MFHTVNKIDLTEFSTLAFRGEFKRGGSANRNLMAACWDSFGTYYDDSHVAAHKDAPSEISSELVVDISKLSGSYIVGLGMTDSEAAVEEIVMEADNTAAANAAAYDDLIEKAAAFDLLMEGVYG